MEQIIIYTRDNCMPCHMTKEQFKRHEVDYIEVNLDENPDRIEEVRALGFSSMPVVHTPKETFCHFKPDKIKALAV